MFAAIEVPFFLFWSIVTMLETIIFFLFTTPMGFGIFLLMGVVIVWYSLKILWFFIKWGFVFAIPLIFLLLIFG